MTELSSCPRFPIWSPVPGPRFMFSSKFFKEYGWGHRGLCYGILFLKIGREMTELSADPRFRIWSAVPGTHTVHDFTNFFTDYDRGHWDLCYGILYLKIGREMTELSAGPRFRIWSPVPGQFCMNSKFLKRYLIRGVEAYSLVSYFVKSNHYWRSIVRSAVSNLVPGTWSAVYVFAGFFYTAWLRALRPMLRCIIFENRTRNAGVIGRSAVSDLVRGTRYPHGSWFR